MQRNCSTRWADGIFPIGDTIVCVIQTTTHAAALPRCAFSCRQMFAEVAEWEKAGSDSLGIAGTHAAQRIISA